MWRAVESAAHFQAGVVVEEADETVFWLEPLVDAGIVKKQLMESLLTEEWLNGSMTQ